jgi:formylglycine-generating enzyme required for sulfatase activity
MVDIAGAFCIDRFEASLVDAVTKKPLSPYYPPSPEAMRREYRRWQLARRDAPTHAGRQHPVPAPSEWELAASAFDPAAVSTKNTVPNGYLSGEMAARACRRVGKRLCSAEEWVRACRGRQNRQFPYGHLYEDRRCNVFRGTHPGALLHGDPSVGHLDPRLNQIDEGGDPLLRPSGSTPGCVSEWRDDGVHDMVGNLDEWIDDPDGTFVGGFYARSTRPGCDARVEVHSLDYYDYSLGTRCCR